MSPFSHFLHDLRMRHEIRQSDLAELLGYEQSYISALEIGVKGPPTSEFVEKLVTVLALTPLERAEARQIMEASQRKFVLDSDSPQDLFWMFKELREQMNALRPVQIKMIRDVLGMTGSLAEPEPEPVRRLRRRRKEEARM